MILIMASIGLFFTSKFKPELYQESDNIYAGIGFVCGLILVFSLDLGAAMIFQQMLMIGALVTIMWQFLQVRAENKRLKGGGRSNTKEERSTGRRGGYSARLDDEPEYVPQKRSRPRDTDRSDRQFQPSSYDDGFREPDRRGSRMLPSGYTRDEPLPDVRQRNDYAPEYGNNYDRYEERATNSRDDRSRRVENLPADDWSAPAENRDWEANSRPQREEKPSSPRKKPRRSSLEDSADEPAAKSTAYVEYEPVDPVVNGQPVEFPDQY
jgi:Ycf66 protein N-terminus